MWEAWEADDQKSARSKLETLMKVVGMEALKDPLTDTSHQLENMLTHFSKDLSPHDSFWSDLAQVVRTGMPDGLGGTSELAKNIHQFRYVIDAQQVAYVREKYKDVGGTDADKLAAYLREPSVYSRGDKRARI